MKTKNVMRLIAAVAITAAAVTGCGGSGAANSPAAGSASGDRAAALEEVKADSGKTMNLLAWEGIESDAIEELEKLTGYKINYTPFMTLEEMMTKSTSNSVQYDAAMCSDYIIEALLAQNELEEIDTSKISNYEKIGAEFLNPGYDPDNKWSVPYSGGQIGIMINRDKVTTDIRSYADLWKPELAGQIAFTSDMRMAMSIANLVNGNDFNAADEAQILAAKDKLTELLPNVVSFEYMGTKTMLSGDVNVLVTSSSAAYKVAKEAGNWEYVYPEEGMHRYMDSYVIPKGANMDAAYAFINAVISKEYLLRKGADTNFGNQYTNKEVLTDADLTELEMSICYPPEEQYEKAHYMENIGDGALIYDECWTGLKLEAAGKLE
ncbi:spermidine/putrescine ABC transporter substrate-binding protein [Lachnospiraceae bacterium 54-53]